MVKIYVTVIKYIILTLLVGSSLYFLYNYIYTKGYNKAKTECETLVNKYEAEIIERIEGIEQKSSLLIEQSKVSMETARIEFEKLEKLAKTKPASEIKTIIHENGTTIQICSPSEEFIEIFNSAIDRANSK